MVDWKWRGCFERFDFGIFVGLWRGGVSGKRGLSDVIGIKVDVIRMEVIVLVVDSFGSFVFFFDWLVVM